jgi:type IV pilus assembly protein PilY1
MKKIFLLIIVSIFLINIRADSQTMSEYTAAPPFLSKSVPPMVMMVMGRDHKLYYEAYNDASDLDDDGQLDIGYKHSIEYYGYFDPYKCYTYDTTGTPKFVPVSTNTDKYCASGSGYWSGNFLNWVTTSRIDALRKVFYGGKRLTDSSSETVLVGGYIPQDAHSWGKEFQGADTPKLTPYTDPSGGGTLPTSAVPWDQTQKILLVTYDDSTSNKYGNDHTDLVNSYSLCYYNSYSYISDFNDASVNPGSDHIETGNFILVSEFYVSPSQGSPVAQAIDQNGLWAFAVDSDDGAEVEIYDTTTSTGTVVASYYGTHGQCNCQTHSGTITLNSGRYYRMIVRQRENTGGDGVKVWYKVDTDNDGSISDETWYIFGSETNSNKNWYITFRAPNVPPTETVRFLHSSFITTSEPAYDPAGTTTIACSVGRHLFCVTSLSDGADPVIRVLQNKSNRIWEWASKERPVCDTSLGTPTDFYIRVEVCNPTPSIGLESNCREYPSGSRPYKPAGLFQKYGESTEKVCSKSFNSCNTDSDCDTTTYPNQVCIDKGKMFFGLMSGSYTKNLSGGVVRWNIDAITHAVDNRNVGIIKTSSANMLTNLDSIKIKGFRYSDQSYQDTGANCGWLDPPRALSEGECRMWGNPIAEMLYEATRYFAGKDAPTTDYSAGTGNTGTDDAVIGLTNQSDTTTGAGVADQDNWIPPYNKYPSCSKPFIITLSDVSPSYDSDQLPGIDSPFGTFTEAAGQGLTGINVKTLADAIGTTEGINGSNAFIGQSGATLDFICSSKLVSAFGSIRGLCPEEPTKKGSYYSAAVAHYGKTLFSTNNGGKPNITTYSVALESPVPEIKVTAGGKTVKIIPVGKSVSGCSSINTYCNSKCTLTYDALKGITISNCASDAYCPSNQIVDFYIDTLTSTYGGFRVNFEDVEQGADHDMDAIVQYSYLVNADNTVTISLNSSSAAGCIDQVMGFVIQGTTEDGLYLPVRDADSGTTDADTPSTVSGSPTTWSHTFTPSTAGATTALLKNPLWYAAKWGGFEDKNGNSKPDQSSEWDEDGDGVPDTYFPVTNPLKMEEQLTQVFNDILRRVGSATSISVLSTSASGAGNIFQAYFLPAQTVDNEDITWLGHLLELGVSEKGELLDKNGNTLTFSFDEAEGQTYINVGGSQYALTEWTGYKWDAGEKLVTKTPASRTIKTFADADNDGVVDSGEYISFEDTNKITLKPYLRAANDTESANIINFVRGSNISGYRNRTYTDGTNQYKFGDIIYSTPTVVTSPAENYSLLYGDKTYATFFEANKSRDTVVYIGNNDGMLHAICADDDKCKNGTVDNGEELWSYIPQNLLPHLKWLTDPNYSHVYYVDLRAKVTDINFSNMGTNGWKTVLIGGMRLGGGQISVTADFGTGSQIRKFQSSYFAIDITDPHNPALLWEFTLSDASLGFTNSYPTIAKVGNKWFVIIGSGSKSLYTPDYTGASAQTGKIFVLDARNTTGAWTLNSTYWVFDTKTIAGDATDKIGFMGDPLTVDIDFANTNSSTDGTSTYNTEVIYIGETYDSGGTPKWRGRLFRIVLWDSTSGKHEVDPTKWGKNVLFDGGSFATATPITISPAATKDELNNLWVYFGTGRFYSDPDKATTTAHTFIGIRDSYWDVSTWKPCWNGTSWSTNTQCTTSGITLTSSLYNSGNVTSVVEGGSSGTVVNTATSSNILWNDFVKTVSEDQNIRGWYINLSAGAADAGAERVITKPTVIGGNVLFTTFIPKTDICQYGGTSNLYSLYYKTGTAYKESTLETPLTEAEKAAGTTRTVKKSISLGYGMASAPAIHIGQQEGGKATVFVQDSTGRINTIEYQLELPRSGVISWKEV